MDQMINELGREDVYILILLLLAVVAGIIILAVFVVAKRREPKPVLPPFSGVPRAKLEPSNELSLPEASITSVPAARDLREELARGSSLPADDVPDDLEALEVRSIPSDPTVPVHSLAEIQRQEPRPLGSALANTRSSFFGRLKSVFGAKPALTADEMDEIEEILYTSDLGPQTVERLLDAVKAELKKTGGSGFESVRSALKEQMLQIFSTADEERRGSEAVGSPAGASATVSANGELGGLEHLAIWNHKPAVIMVVGVNGAGKTTTIGKLASKLARSGRRVLVAAGDTFRAAAGDQLKVWTERAQVTIFNPEGVSDPSAVGFKACEMAVAEGFDVVIIDTAGRLHTQKNLMEELKKMKRVMAKPIPTAPHEVLLVLDANSGQNALIQAREFHQALGVTGVVLTKLDGSAKGGVAVGLAGELGLSIKLIGVGEGIDDLRNFSAPEFVASII
jgi:fused signal recognition particle receptor